MGNVQCVWQATFVQSVYSSGWFVPLIDRELQFLHPSITSLSSTPFKDWSADVYCWRRQMLYCSLWGNENRWMHIWSYFHVGWNAHGQFCIVCVFVGGGGGGNWRYSILGKATDVNSASFQFFWLLDTLAITYTISLTLSMLFYLAVAIFRV